MRVFETGATRDDDTNKFDYEGFLSPLVIERYAEYMHKCRLQADGKLRASDNWQLGQSPIVYMKSLYRHFVATWKMHRICYHPDKYSTIPYNRFEQEENLCAILFNTMGYLHEILAPPQLAPESEKPLPKEEASYKVYDSDGYKDMLKAFNLLTTDFYAQPSVLHKGYK